MTDDTDTTRDRRTAPNQTDEQLMKHVEHAPPVDGARRTFERDAEGRPARTDGGQDEEEDSEDEAEATDEEERADQMRDVDHTSPVEGPNRTFERGKDTDVRE